MTRRDYLELMAAGAAATAAARTLTAAGGEADREARMKWWHEARFGMFIHWGLYSVLARHEWVMENEGIPVAEYEQLGLYRDAEAQMDTTKRVAREEPLTWEVPEEVVWQRDCRALEARVLAAFVYYRS